jgi:hypothetical protein
VVEGTTLERWHTRKGIEGSNPSLSVPGTESSRATYFKGIAAAQGSPRAVMLVNRPPDVPSSEITEESLYWNRREFLKAADFSMAALSGLAPAASRLAAGV